MMVTGEEFISAEGARFVMNRKSQASYLGNYCNWTGLWRDLIIGAEGANL